MESHVKDLQGKTCLELGAGTGLVSIVAWLLGNNTIHNPSMTTRIILLLILIESYYSRIGASNVLATDLAGPHTEHVQRNTSVNADRIVSERRRAIQDAETQVEAQGQGRAISLMARRRRDQLKMLELESDKIQVAPLDW